MEHHSNRMYFIIYLVLLALLLLTVGVAYLELGAFTLATAIAIATVKAVLVLLYFMHVADRTPLVWVFAFGGFLWLGILLVLTFSDYVTRLPVPHL